MAEKRCLKCTILVVIEMWIRIVAPYDLWYTDISGLIAPVKTVQCIV